MKKVLLVAIPIILLLALVGFRVVQKTGAEAASKKQSAARKNAPTTVEVATTGPKSVSNTVDAVASLESPFTVKLSPNVAGRIDYLEVREGDSVQAGQILARIDPAEVEGEILQSQSALAEAQQKLSQARITENSNTVGIYSTINQNKAAVASSAADYNEVSVTYEATVAAAHEATVDAESKVRAARSNIETASANQKLAEANLVDSKAKYTREHTLYTQGFVAPQDLDDARAAEKVNEAQVNAAEKMVDAAKSALESAEAEFRAAANQEAIAKKKGLSDIQDAKAKLTQSDATLGTAVANKAQIPAYTENLKALYSEVVAAKATLAQAVARRQYLIVKSSINGTVTQRLADPGAEASPGSQILVIQYLKWLYVTSAMPVEFAEQIHPGLDVTMRLDAIPGRIFHTKIVDINKSADPSSRQFMIRMRVENDNNIFRPGMYARLNMVTSHIDADIAVPREAVATDASNNSTVTTVDSNNVAHVVPVTIGAQDSMNIQITSGLKAGEKVIILSYRPVKDGAKVTIGSLAGKSGKGKAGSGAGAADSDSAAGAAPAAGTTGGGSSAPAGAATGSGGGGALSPLSSPVSPATTPSSGSSTTPPAVTTTTGSPGTATTGSAPAAAPATTGTTGSMGTTTGSASGTGAAGTTGTTGAAGTTGTGAGGAGTGGGAAGGH